ncbi:FAD-dependent oxidoreductase [Maribacter sp. 2307ULW6-5]|uniref:FAD-dependent oxidoreductase n=1 Tax=Maribacter sp. 2307ULW6-5 TaxID=3386275 RepID=UPI0039BC56AF
MEKKDRKIAIIGAGVSGLIAAKVLENKGYAPTIYERSEGPGGRVKTTVQDGHLLDHGFQVLLDAYPLAKKYLNYQDLELQHFLPGAHIYERGKKVTLGDPLREPSLLFPTLTSGVGTLGDKVKILKLNSSLKKKSIEAIFQSEERSTMAYLKEKGFSEAIISQFFRPFFAGIFLEPDLATSSRMFEFVYKMFGTGHATLPKAGITAIPQQLVSQLKQTTIRYNSAVSSCEDHTVFFEDGTKTLVDFTIVATEAAPLIANMRNQGTEWKSVDNLYFSVPKADDARPMIGLVPDPEAYINNLHFVTNLPTTSQGQGQLLSVSVVKQHTFTEYELINTIKEELKLHCGITDVTYLKTFNIKKALPKLKDLRYGMDPTETRLTNTMFLAGDYLLNGSLNAAMHAGELAAEGLLEVVDGAVKL